MVKKILGVIDEDPFDYRTWSGSSKYFFGGLAEVGVLYDAISASPSRLGSLFYKLKSFDVDLEKWKFKYHLNTDLFAGMTKKVARRINNEIDNFDVILQVGAWYNFSDVVSDKLLVSYHDGNLATRLSSPYSYPSVSNKYIRNAFEYERRLYNCMDYVLPMSKWLASSFIKDFGVDPKKVVPVGAGINLPRIGQPMQKDNETPVVLFVGKDFERKGGAYLLEAFVKVRKVIKDARLVIVGPEHLTRLPDGVTNVGYVSKNDSEGVDKLISLYERASLFVLPSIYEPFGIAFAEAMAHKLPCIGSNACAMPEIIENGYNGYTVNPGDVDLLAEKMLVILGDDDMREEMGQNAYRRYYNEYRWPVVADKIAAIVS